MRWSKPWTRERLGHDAVMRACAVAVTALGALLAADPAQAGAAKTPLAKAGLTPQTGLAPIGSDADENITVMGHRRFSLAPLPGANDVAPPPPTGFAPGARIGPFVVTGGPTNSLTSNGVAAGLALPIKSVKGLEFGAQLTGSRDQVAPTASAAGMAATAGFKLHF